MAMIREQVSALTKLTLAFGSLTFALLDNQINISERLQELAPDDDDAIRLSSRLEQLQASVRDLRAGLDAAERSARDSGLIT